ncbi:MAG TPA: hypothetical protein VF125_05125 [Solirubrobacterales bacterium]
MTGCGGGDDSGSNVAATSEPETTTETIRKTGPTVAVLHPVGEYADAKGTARYSKKPNGVPLLKLRAEGLEPTSGRQQYVVWQTHSRDDMYTLATWVVGKDGRMIETWEPNFASLQYLELGLRTKLVITRVENYARLYEPAPTDDSYKHNFIGKPVLEGQFEGAIVGALEEE